MNTSPLSFCSKHSVQTHAARPQGSQPHIVREDEQFGHEKRKPKAPAQDCSLGMGFQVFQKV